MFINYHNLKTNFDINSVSNSLQFNMTGEIRHLHKTLYLSIKAKSMEIFDHVLDRILCVSSLNSNRAWEIDGKWYSPLVCAIKNHHEMALKLINNGCRIHFKNKNGETPLMVAIQHQPQSQVALKLIDVSIEQGWEFNSQNKSGWNALLLATRYGQPEVALKLIENGCELNSQLHNGCSWRSYASDST